MTLWQEEHVGVSVAQAGKFPARPPATLLPGFLLHDIQWVGVVVRGGWRMDGGQTGWAFGDYLACSPSPISTCPLPAWSGFIVGFHTLPSSPSHPPPSISGTWDRRIGRRDQDGTGTWKNMPACWTPPVAAHACLPILLPQAVLMPPACFPFCETALPCMCLWLAAMVASVCNLPHAFFCFLCNSSLTCSSSSICHMHKNHVCGTHLPCSIFFAAFLYSVLPC